MGAWNNEARVEFHLQRWSQRFGKKRFTLWYLIQRATQRVPLSDVEKVNINSDRPLWPFASDLQTSRKACQTNALSAKTYPPSTTCVSTWHFCSLAGYCQCYYPSRCSKLRSIGVVTYGDCNATSRTDRYVSPLRRLRLLLPTLPTWLSSASPQPNGFRGNSNRRLEPGGEGTAVSLSWTLLNQVYIFFIRIL